MFLMAPHSRSGNDFWCNTL